MNNDDNRSKSVRYNSSRRRLLWKTTVFYEQRVRSQTSPYLTSFYLLCRSPQSCILTFEIMKHHIRTVHRCKMRLNISNKTIHNEKRSNVITSFRLTLFNFLRNGFFIFTLWTDLTINNTHIDRSIKTPPLPSNLMTLTTILYTRKIRKR